MSGTRESKIYLCFFRQNLSFIVIPAISLAVAGYLYYQSLPFLYRMSTLLEMEYEAEDLPQKNLLTDEAVTMLRLDVLRSGKTFDRENRIRLYKVGPVAVSAEAVGPSETRLNEDLSKIVDKAVEKYAFKEMGMREMSVKKLPAAVFILLGFGLGFLGGLCFSLVKTYLQKF